MNRKRLSRIALRKSLDIRREAGVKPEGGINVYDLADHLDIEVRFLNVPSMEGMYSRRPGPVIVISSERPAGRQRFTTAHEIGHHVFGHGSTIDQLKGKPFDRKEDADEFLVDAFAGFLLMPKIAIQHAFLCRDWSPENLTPTRAYVLACSFGVGYSTFLHHSSRVAQVVPVSLAGKLDKTQPKEIRSRLLGHAVPKHLMVVDEHWNGRPIDLQVGDLVLSLLHVEAESRHVRRSGSTMHGPIYEAISPGIDRMAAQNEDEWVSFVRVSRAGYAGRSKYRHLEASEENYA